MSDVQVKLVNSEQVALVDEECAGKVLQFAWKLNSGGYAYANANGRMLLLHRFVMGVETAASDLFVDHIFGNRLDNRTSQLRCCSPKENGMNKGKPKGETSSQFKGVSFDPRRNRWLACIHIDGKSVFLGRFATEQEAASAYNRSAEKEFGEYARLNIVVEMTVTVL